MTLPKFGGDQTKNSQRTKHAEFHP